MKIKNMIIHLKDEKSCSDSKTLFQITVYLKFEWLSFNEIVMTHWCPFLFHIVIKKAHKPATSICHVIQDFVKSLNLIL